MVKARQGIPPSESCGLIAGWGWGVHHTQARLNADLQSQATTTSLMSAQSCAQTPLGEMEMKGPTNG